MSYSWLKVTLLLSLALVSCRVDVDLDAPPEIKYGQDVCEQCQMIISEERFAASYVTTTGDFHIFDGIGEMLSYQNEHPEEEIRQSWVHDYNSKVWLPADEASFVQQMEIATPMGWGIVAFATAVDAEQFAATHNGMVTSYVALQAVTLKKP